MENLNNQDVKISLASKYVVVTKRYGRVAYWAEDKMGYEDTLFLAGLYSRDAANEILKNNNCGVATEVKDFNFSKHSNWIIPYMVLINELAQKGLK